MMTSSSTATTTTAFIVYFLAIIAPSTSATSSSSSSSSSAAICLFRPYSWLADVQSLSPLYYSPLSLNSPIQVDGNFLDRTVAKLGSGHIAILFHATWCPFSRESRPIFETLSLLFPEIEHLTIEQSSAMPSVLSRYGIHSFPAILIVSQSSSIRYHRPRDLFSLIQFYKQTTGAEPVQYLTTDHLMSLSNIKGSDTLTSSDSSLKQILSREPYLTFSILFIILRFAHYSLPGALAFAKSVLHRFVIPQMNWEIFGETIQIFGRALHMIDVKRFWTKLKVCKTRNFHQRARSARVWASSLASVSVGEN